MNTTKLFRCERSDKMANLFISLLLVVGLLDFGLCVVDVACEPSILETDEPTPDCCYFRDFPSSDSNHEVYNISVDYAEASEITRLEFLSTPTVKYFPSEIFIAFPNLETLIMAANLEELDSDDFIHAMNLSELNLSGNKLKVIRNVVFSPVARFAQEQSIDITTLSTEHGFPRPLYKLSVLKLNQNEISEIEDNSFNGLNNIFDLRLKENRLKIIRRQTFAGLPGLVFLDLAKNEIETIEDGALNFHDLEALYLSENRLKSLSDGVFDRLNQIGVLLLDRNELEHIGHSLYSILSASHIFLEENRIQDIDLAAFAQMPNLIYLSLGHSGFTFAATKIEDDRQWDNQLSFLNLSYNNLSNATELINLRIFPQVTELILDGNPYKNLSIENDQASDTPKPKPRNEHKTIENVVHLALSKPYVATIKQVIMQFKPKPTPVYRTIIDVLPKLSKLQLNGTRIDCASMLSIARQLKSKHVGVKHDC